VAGAGLARRGELAREGPDVMFKFKRLGLPNGLRRSLRTTNLIGKRHSALRNRVRRVKYSKIGEMA
jgi:hypothetical protein